MFLHFFLRYNPPDYFVSADISAALPPGATRRSGRHFLGIALGVAGLANVLVPAVLFSETHLFGQTDPSYRALVAVVVLAEYAITFSLLFLHTNVGFASGYSVATAAIVTLGSAALAFPLRNADHERLRSVDTRHLLRRLDGVCNGCGPPIERELSSKSWTTSACVDAVLRRIVQKFNTRLFNRQDAGPAAGYRIQNSLQPTASGHRR